MNIRKSIYTLTPAQLQAFKDALNAIKADGGYDDFIERHHHSMMTATLSPGEVGGPSFRNVAHRGPAFLPWHRYFCRELELILQAKNPLVTLPYWNWAAVARDVEQGRVPRVDLERVRAHGPRYAVTVARGATCA